MRRELPQTGRLRDPRPKRAAGLGARVRDGPARLDAAAVVRLAAVFQYLSLPAAGGEARNRRGGVAVTPVASHLVAVDPMLHDWCGLPHLALHVLRCKWLGLRSAGGGRPTVRVCSESVALRSAAAHCQGLGAVLCTGGPRAAAIDDDCPLQHHPHLSRLRDPRGLLPRPEHDILLVRELAGNCHPHAQYLPLCRGMALHAGDLSQRDLR
mmetsp:Transcript_64380/g.186615  ORF Transcript_64380/g.186615 Transcript_64380/m.186615 type:complete len:210 (+) Transcript_64380:519-1148(+)